MLLTSHLQGLAVYFRHSTLFYYFTTDLNGHFTYVNGIFQERFGHVADDFHSAPAASIFIESDQESLKKIFNQCLQQPGARVCTELRVSSSGGSVSKIIWEFSAVLDNGGEPEYIQAVGVPVDETSALAETEKIARQQAIILNNVTDTIVTTDMNRRITSWNKVTEKLTGIPEEKALGKIPSEILDNDYYPYTHEQVAEIVFSDGIWRGEMSFTGADGERKYFLHTISLLYNEKGEKIGLLGVGKDITARKETEDKLKESEHRFREMIYNLNQGVIMVNEKREVIGCNYAAQSFIGMSEEQIIGRTFPNPGWSLQHEDGTEFTLEEYPSCIAIETKKPVRSVLMGLQTRSEGERAWLMVNANPTLDANGNVLYVVLSFSEITTQRKLSQQLIEQEIQKQKQLTQATIDGQEKERQEIGKELHDNINQHLTTTRLYLEVAKEKASGSVLEMIQLSHKTLVGIINEIRSMSQSLVPPTLGDIGLVESVQDLCDSLKRAHTFSIEFFHRHFYEERFPANMKLMLFRIIQEQVSNIIRHAQAEHVSIKLQSDAENIILTIIDNGKGFDAGNVKKGLGFSNMFNRSSLFNGKMDIEAAPGKGCKLIISIPLEADGLDPEAMEK